MHTKFVGRRASLAYLCMVMALLLSFVVPTLAQDVPLPLPPSSDGSSVSGSRLDFSEVQLDEIVKHSVTYPDGRVSVIVSLAGETGVRSSSSAALRSQDNFLSRARSLGATVTNRTYYLTNTVTVAIAPDSLAQLSALPGVTGVYPNAIVHRDDTVSVPFIGAPSVWEGIDGYTGAGTVISIIDSGIDFTHTHFGGDGDFSSITDTTVLAPGAFGAFPIVAVGDQKVVGGFDFVGDAYNAASFGSALIPVPDPNPLDCAIEDGGGHGTHVAGTAAGWGVNADGTTYTGPFDTSLFPDYPGWTSAFRIGPGVAPEAGLLAMRVFGCEGSTSVDNIIAAIEASVAGEVDFDGNTITFPPADVINMSLGAAYGTSDPTYPYNVTIKAATEAGVLVVTSAGNSGPTQFITGSPGAANEAISVANTLDLGNQARAVRNDATSTLAAAAYGAGSPFFHAPLTAVSVISEPANGCGAITNDIAGKIVIIDRGVCPFAEKQNNAFIANAAGVIVADNAAGGLLTMVGSDFAEYDLPTVFISQADGVALKASVDGTNTITMDSSLGVFLVEVGDTLSSSSSRGPARFNTGSLKPDIAAPGTTILSAGSGSGNQTYNISGTSMAAPHVAGVMALLVEKYPTWTADELKALVMGTATNDVFLGANAYGPQTVGAGRVDVVNAFDGEVIAYNTTNPGGVSLHFGYPKVLQNTPLVEVRTITVENKGSSAQEYDVSYVARTTMNGVSYSVSPASITVPAGGSVTIDVEITADLDVADVNANGDPTFAPVPLTARFAEAAGYVVLEATTSTPDLRVPVYAAPRLSSSLTAAIDATVLPALNVENTFTFTGEAVNTGGIGANNVISIATAYELMAISGVDATIPAHTDISHVGISSEYLDGGPFDMMYVAIATHGQWDSLNNVWFEVYVDVNQDGNDDIGFYTTTSAANPHDYQVGLIDIPNFFDFGAGARVCCFGVRLNGFAFNVANTYTQHNNVITLPIFVKDFFGDHGAVDITIVTQDLRYDGSDTVSFTYDPNTPAYDFGGFTPMVIADATEEYDFAVTAGNEADLTDILVLHHHNGTSTAQVIPAPTLAAGIAFDLLTPADGTVITSIDTLPLVTAITWEESTGADTYDFVLDRPGALADVVLADLTPADDADPLTCDAGVCTLTLANGLVGIVTQNGDYVWDVFAVIDGVGFTPSNEAFSFTVNIPMLSGGFSLLSPADGAFVTEGTDITEITWSAAENATDYEFTLFKISNNVSRTLGVALQVSMTAADDGDDLTCEDGVCVFSVDPAVAATLTTGHYAWTVVASGFGGTSVEAANGPFFFMLDTGEIELIYNGGFEIDLDGVVATPDGWNQKNSTQDRVRCNDKAYAGDCFYDFRPSATEDSRINQNLNVTGLKAGDVLDFSFYLEAPATGDFLYKVVAKYTDPSIERTVIKERLRDSLLIVGGYAQYTDTLILAGDPDSIKLVFRSRTKVGRVRLDDVSLKLNRSSPVPDLLPVPDALPLPDVSVIIDPVLPEVESDVVTPELDEE